jgi:hypothetical protein
LIDCGDSTPCDLIRGIKPEKAKEKKKQMGNNINMHMTKLSANAIFVKAI